MPDAASRQKLSKQETLDLLVAEHAQKMADAMLLGDVFLAELGDEDESAIELTAVLDTKGLYFLGSEYNLLGGFSRVASEIDLCVLTRYAKNIDEIERAVNQAIEEKNASLDEAIKIMEAKLGKADASKVKASEAG